MYENYDEGTLCKPVMMREPFVYENYDEGTLCTSVMMREPCVRQL